MGILKAGLCAIRGAAADQWKEVFCAGEMDSGLLMIRAKKLTSQSGSNAGGAEVITDGSVIFVGEGECALATEGGKVIGVYDQPGEQIFKSNQSSGFFGGGIGAFLKDVGRRIGFGGDVAISQRLYYINTKELTGGTIRAEELLVRGKDPRTGLDTDCRISCSGSYTFRIADPALFFKAAIRTTDVRERAVLQQQMDNEVRAALASALTQLAAEGIRPTALLQHTEALGETLRRVMCDQWSGQRGIEVCSVALESVRLLDIDRFHVLQQAAAYQNPSMAVGRFADAQADAIRTAATNPSGTAISVRAAPGGPAAGNGLWKCSCGFENTGNFCAECGNRKPAATSACRCSQCGWQPTDHTKVPRFCTECGNPFNAGDKE